MYSQGSSDDVFARIFYNDLLTNAFHANGFDFNLYFFDRVPVFDGINDDPVSSEEMNRLELSRLFVLTSSGTASASELIITGLSPYLDVTLIGTTTVGKNVGSITLYDSPEEGYTGKNNANPSHTYAMQPIISQLANSEGFDYANGFEPDIEIKEVDYIGEWLPLGDESEPLLAQALEIISGMSRSVPKPSMMGIKKIYDSKERRPFLYRGVLDANTIDLKLE